MTNTTDDLAKLFKDQQLFRSAFVHRSYLNESKEFPESNERLEYLGDAVLELATSEFLYTKYKEYQEGMLTNLRAALVRTESLAEAALSLDFSNLLLMSKGEEATGGRNNTSLLANTFEAFLGALYLDQGYTVCVTFCHKHLFPKIEGIISSESYKDHKSVLQEVSQSKFKTTPSYELKSEKGPDHDKTFQMVAVISGKEYEVGEGKSKQAAQESAAKNTLEKIASV